MAANQEISVPVPLPQYISDAARVAGEAAARKVIDEHIKNCPIRTVQADVKSLTIWRAKMIGWMIGSGLASGGSVVAVMKLLGG